MLALHIILLEVQLYKVLLHPLSPTSPSLMPSCQYYSCQVTLVVQVLAPKGHRGLKAQGTIALSQALLQSLCQSPKAQVIPLVMVTGD